MTGLSGDYGSMEDSTLVTFRVPDVHHAGSVDVYGSWDNFSRPYPLMKDSQIGHGHWYGCHGFEHIICDGDPSARMEPRDGHLKMKGTYWYFYKRDDDVEFHNPCEPSTNACPLNPGQTVNVLTVPNLLSSSFSLTPAHPQEAPGLTLDLRKRWTTPHPPRRRERKISEQTVPAVRPCPASAHDESRAWWFRESYGRLQTAVVAHVITGYKGTELSDERRYPVKLPYRRIRTPDNISCHQHNYVSTGQQTDTHEELPMRFLDQPRPQSRYGQPADYGRPTSSRIFSNPFQDPSTYALRNDPFGSLSATRPQTWVQADSVDSDDDESEPRRPLSAPEVVSGKRGLVTLFKVSHVPQRSQTQVYRTNPNNRWRRGQVFADSVETDDTACHQISSDESKLDYIPAAMQETHLPTDTTPNASQLAASIAAAGERIESFRLTSLAQLPSLETKLHTSETSPKQHSGEAKYVSEHDLWTPATSPSKGASGISTTNPSQRTSFHNWHVQTPVSPAELSSSYTASQIATSSLADSTIHPAAPRTTPAWRPSPNKSERSPDFGASQETITGPPAEQVPMLSRTGSLSIGALAFERSDNDEAHQRTGSNSSELGDLSDLSFMNFSIT